MTNDEKTALLNMIQVCSFSNNDAEDYYDALNAAFPSVGNTDGLSSPVKTALLNIFQNAGGSTQNWQTAYNALQNVFFPEMREIGQIKK